MPPILLTCTSEEHRCNILQMMMQMHDKQLVSTKTLLAAFMLDEDVERDNIEDYVSYIKARKMQESTQP
jgi:hypothetical protein